MARLVHVGRAQVKAASARFEKLLAKDPVGKEEMRERARHEKAEKARRDKEFAATQSKARPRRAKK
jgi:uncharacterized protein YaiL (DUF2058 family)